MYIDEVKGQNVKRNGRELLCRYALSAKLDESNVGAGVEVRIESKELYMNKETGKIYVWLDAGIETASNRPMVYYIGVDDEKRYFRFSSDFYKKFVPATCIFNTETKEYTVVETKD